MSRHVDWLRQAENVTTSPWSDLDVLVVFETGAPFVERPRAFSDVLDLGVPVDILVHTPAEFSRLRREKAGFWKKFERPRTRIRPAAALSRGTLG